jgi:type III pantothenate kinase
VLLSIDIGNTNIVLGLFEGEEVKKKWRLLSDIQKSCDDYAVDIIELFLTEKIDCMQVSGVMIASVVPTLTDKIEAAVRKFVNENVPVLVVGHKNVELGIEIKLANKKEVGADRLVNAVAGFEKFGGNLIIIDFGTATTFDVVGAEGEYLGGVIAPGVNLSLKALYDMTAQLPKISLKAQKNVIGKSTVEAMNSGVYFGYISMVEGMIAKIEAELGAKTTKIITGGLAEIFYEPLKETIHHHEPNLTLKGLQLIFQKLQKVSNGSF